MIVLQKFLTFVGVNINTAKLKMIDSCHDVNQNDMFCIKMIMIAGYENTKKMIS